MNIYAYVRGDPVNAGDPSGLCLGFGGQSCGSMIREFFKDVGSKVSSFASKVSGSFTGTGGFFGGIGSGAGGAGALVGNGVPGT